MPKLPAKVYFVLEGKTPVSVHLTKDDAHADAGWLAAVREYSEFSVQAAKVEAVCLRR